MQSGYNPYMPVYPYSTYNMMQPSCMECPYMMTHEEGAPEYTETSEEPKNEEEGATYRQPPFVPRPPFYGPRPPFFGPRPPFYGPRPPFFVPPPFIPPYPYYPYPRPFGGLPFLTGLALGGLLF